MGPARGSGVYPGDAMEVWRRPSAGIISSLKNGHRPFRWCIRSICFFFFCFLVTGARCRCGTTLKRGRGLRPHVANPAGTADPRRKGVQPRMIPRAPLSYHAPRARWAKDHGSCPRRSSAGRRQGPLGGPEMIPADEAPDRPPPHPSLVDIQWPARAAPKRGCF